MCPKIKDKKSIFVLYFRTTYIRNLSEAVSERGIMGP